MKAAIVTAAGKSPVLGEFDEPRAAPEMEVIAVSASALSQFSKSRSAGSHYSAKDVFPAVAGVDGVGHTEDGRRVYFVLPEAPYGALAEKCLVRAEQCVEVPGNLDDAAAAAIANPGMSVWGSQVQRAHLQPGETVLVNGATGSAGRLAVQVAKYLGAGKVIATGRDEQELASLRSLGADAVIPFALGALHPFGAKEYEQALKMEFAQGVDVVVDYLWGESAKTIIMTIARTVEDARPMRFVHVGAASGESDISLPGAALRSSAIQLMGSGAKSIPLPKLLEGIKHIFDIVEPAHLQIATRTMPLSDIEKAWQQPSKPRIVITME